MEGYTPHADPRFPAVRIEFAIARAELEAKAIVRATAATQLAVHGVLAEAREFPETYVPLAVATAPDGANFAVRAAVLDLAVRLNLSEGTIRAYEHGVMTLLARAPRVWDLFREGEVSVPNVRAITDIVADLPHDVWAEFEDAALGSVTLAPARFKTRMRAVRERLGADAVARHRKAGQERRVWVDHDLDGMSDFGVHGPAAACVLAMANIDRIARELASLPDERRTLAQLRADVALDLMAGNRIGGRAEVVVGLLMPVMGWLGKSDEAGILENYGPIDAETARELAGGAKSIYRILTDKITGELLHVESPNYRPPAHMARAVKLRDQTCTVPGCGRSAVTSDLDHTVAWPVGPTAYSNLKVLCRHHHRVKHMTLWKSEQATNGATVWTSPTGFARGADPPPF